MEQLTQYYILSSGSIAFYIVDLLLLFLFLIVLIRFLGQTVTGMQFTKVLSMDDNAAAGVALAGGTAAMAIMLTGVSSGDVGSNLVNEATLIVGYSVLGISMMWGTRKVFDHINLGDISIQQGIANGNMAAAIVDAFNMLATAIIVRAVMSWVDGATVVGLLSIVAGFVLSQAILYLATRYRYHIFNRAHKASGLTLHGELESGNCAVALRFGGYRVGVALAVTAASGVVIYDPQTVLMSLLAWALMALLIFLLQTMITAILRPLVLRGIDVASEVVEQKNIAIGAMEGAIAIAVGLIFMGLFG